MIVAPGVELARGERDQHGAVVAVDRDDDRRRRADLRLIEDVDTPGRAVDGGEARAGRLLHGVAVEVDHDDLVGARRHGRAAW